ncbi:MAG: O-antigen ligase family protein, partial [Anaerolineae bacterium]
MALFNLAASGLAGVLWYLWPQLGPWPLLLVLAGQIGRVRSSGQWLPRTRFDAPLLLFFVTALLAATLAYNPTLAWAKFWVIVAGLALYAALASTPEEVTLPRVGVIAPRRLLVGSLASLVALYFLLTNDWLRWQGKLSGLDPLLSWLAAWQPALPGHRLHPNVAGGLIAALLPLQAVALPRNRARLSLLAISSAGLLLTLSRGAWMALLISVGVWWGWQHGRRWLARRAADRSTRIWLLAGLSMILLALLVLGAGRGWYPLPAAVSGRLLIWRHSLDLIGDYAFTGLGLDNFEMAYSSYVMLLHVGYQVHSHNILLNVWLEQGLLGLAAFAWLVLALLRRPAAPSFWRAAALIAVGVILLHGQVDDAFYGSRGVLILFLPWALVASTGETRAAVVQSRTGPGWA